MSTKPDWKKIKLEYIKGKSREEICKEYELKYPTLHSRIVRENWNAELHKIETKVQQKLEEKVSDSLSDKQAKFLERQYKLSEKILNRLEVEFDNSDKLMDLSTAVNTLREGIKLGRSSLNLFDTKTETNTNVNIVNKYKELSDSEIEAELIKRGLPTSIFDE